MTPPSTCHPEPFVWISSRQIIFREIGW